MPVNSVNRKKLDKEHAKKAQKFKDEVKKFEERPTSNFNNEDKKKEDIVEIYKNMSAKEKAAFDKELEKKKIRDNYAMYLKYVYPNYIFTKFHALLANICQSIVEILGVFLFQNLLNFHLSCLC